MRDKQDSWLQQELSKKWLRALVGPPIPTKRSSAAPKNGTPWALKQTPISQRNIQLGLCLSLNIQPPRRHQPIKNYSNDGRKKLHRKSPVTWLTKNASQSPITASWFCCQGTVPLGNAHCLGTTCQLGGRRLFSEGSCPGTKEVALWEARHAPNGTGKPACVLKPGLGKKPAEGWAHWTSVGSDFSPLPSTLHPPPAPSPKRSFNTLLPLKSWGPGDSPGSHMVPMSPWPLHGRGAGKTNESSCNSAAPTIDLPDKRDCRHVPKSVQAPDMQKLFLITGFISFLPPPPSSASANVSKSEQNPNQFQVFRETQRGSSVPGPEPESRTAPWVLQLSVLSLSLEQFKSPTLNIEQMACKRKYLNECALRWNASQLRLVSSSLGPRHVKARETGLRDQWQGAFSRSFSRILYLLCSKD